LNEKIVISEIAVTSRAAEVTIDKAIEILKAAKRADPEASVDLIIHHVKPAVIEYNKDLKEQVKALLREAAEFRALGRFVGLEETFEAKLNSAICFGLAEVCEKLAQVLE